MARIRAYTVSKLADRRRFSLGGYEYLVVWAGYPTSDASWEPRCHIPEELCTAFDSLLASGSTEGLPTEAERIAAGMSRLTSRELTTGERSLLLDSACPVPKQWQSNTPNGGFFSRTWGLLVFNRSCVQVVDFDELFGSESISAVVFALLRLLNDCPGLLDKLRVISYDDACHLLKFLKLRRDVPQYEVIVSRTELPVGHEGRLAVMVDPGHFDVAHKASDVFCRTYTNPHKFDDLRRGQNAEAAEQSNAWLSRFKLIVRQMGPGTYILFLLRMFTRRNRRIVADFCFQAPAVEVARQLWVHGVVAQPLGLDATNDRHGMRLLRTTLHNRLLPVPPPPASARHALCVSAACGWLARAQAKAPTP